MAARTYEVRVQGLIPPDVLNELGITHLIEEPAQTILETEPIDQAALQALLDRLRRFRLELVELRRTPERLDSVAEDGPQ